MGLIQNIKTKQLMRWAIRAGVTAGMLAASLELLRYVFIDIVQNNFLLVIVFLLIFLTAVPLVLHVTRGAATSFKEMYLSILAAYTFYLMVTCMAEVVLHYVIDPNYKQRLAMQKVEALREHNREMEVRLRAEIRSEIDLDELYREAVASFTIPAIAIRSAATMLFILPWSMVVAFALQRLDHHDNTSTAHT